MTPYLVPVIGIAALGLVLFGMKGPGAPPAPSPSTPSGGGSSPSRGFSVGGSSSPSSPYSPSYVPPSVPSTNTTQPSTYAPSLYSNQSFVDTSGASDLGTTAYTSDLGPIGYGGSDSSLGSADSSSGDDDSDSTDDGSDDSSGGGYGLVTGDEEDTSDISTSGPIDLYDCGECIAQTGAPVYRTSTGAPVTLDNLGQIISLCTYN
jgi:hypothetical protein